MLEIAERPKAADVPVADLNRTIDCFAHNTVEVPKGLRILTDNEPKESWVKRLAAESGAKFIAKDWSCFRIMTAKDGDKRIVWCRRVLTQIAEAKKLFMDLMSKGNVPYRVGVDGAATSEVMKEFDPTAEEVIFMPIRAVSGG